MTAARLVHAGAAMDWHALVKTGLDLGIAYALALPLAWDRERHERSAGLRTFPLVALASAAFVLISRRAFGGNAEALARVLEGVVVGIGFIGGGAILRLENRVRGTATAASLWCTGSIGAAVALGHPDVAVLICVIALVTLRGLARFKHSRSASRTNVDGRVARPTPKVRAGLQTSADGARR